LNIGSVIIPEPSLVHPSFQLLTSVMFGGIVGQGDSMPAWQTLEDLIKSPFSTKPGAGD